MPANAKQFRTGLSTSVVQFPEFDGRILSLSCGARQTLASLSVEPQDSGSALRLPKHHRN
jgi:hypothetical protein